MFILSIALGGCLKGPPVQFGLTEDTGGHITYVLGAAMALAARFDVALVEIVTRLIDAPELGPAYAVPLEDVAPNLFIRRIDTGNRAYLSKAANLADRSAFTAALIRHIEGLAIKPDVIHAHFADAGAVAIALRARFDIPFVFTPHSLAIAKSGSATVDLAFGHRSDEEACVIGAADAIIASSRDEAERQLMHYRTACPARIHCVPPGASLDRGAPADPARARTLVAPFLRDPDKPMILAIARPVLKKNLTGLVDLYASDPSLRAKANLVIVAGLRDGPDSGEPEQRKVIGDMLAQLDRHDLYGVLALPKRHVQADIAGLYVVARETGGVFVNPAYIEPYGLTLTEAAVHGLPVVATCFGGAADIVAGLGHGRLADPHDPAAFATAIHALLDDRDEWRQASAAGRGNSAALDWDVYAERFVSIVRSARQVPVPRPMRTATELLLCDIDNTLTGCTTGARRMAIYLRNRPQLAFGVATGRSLQEAERLLREWHLPAPAVLITSVGSEIYWHEGGRLVPDRDFADHIRLDWDADEIDDRIAAIAGIERQPLVEQRRHKRSYFASDPVAVAAARAAIADMAVTVIHSHTSLLDILPQRAGKGAAMRWAARRMGIGEEAVYAAGDSGNDLDMLGMCRNPILVANYSSELASLVDRPSVYVARRPHAGGIVEGMRVFARRRAA